MKGIRLSILFLLWICVWMGCGTSTADTRTQLNDITGHWAYEPITYLVEEGAVSGYEDGSFLPDRTITRAEFITIANRYFGFDDRTAISYPDVRTGSWYYDEIRRARAAGYISGYPDGTMHPDQPISRQEAAAILVKVLDLNITGGSLNFRDRASIPTWSKDSIAALVRQGRISGYPDNTFRPEKSITRAETAVIISGRVATPAPAPAGGVYNIKDFGAQGDGKTDDSSAVQKAADKARDESGSLLVPVGNYLVRSTVRFYTSVNCQGKFTLQNGNSNSKIIIARWGRFVRISPQSLGGLVQGSTKISGMEGFSGGTAVLKSRELLVERERWGSDYLKADTVEILDNSGNISPALDCTYNDLSQLTLVAYAYEQPIVIAGLKVEASGEAAGNSHLVYCVRSNVTFESPSIINIARTGTAGCGLHIYDSVNVKVNAPVISNFKPRGGDGYGIALGETANVSIYDGKITACSNHAITGRLDKKVLIRGGIYEGTNSPLDNHWGTDFLVEGAVLQGDIGITYAGDGITVRNCTIKDCISIFDVRKDTPSLSGRVVMENIRAELQAGQKKLYCYRTSGAGGAIPDLVSVSDLTAVIPADGFLVYYDLHPDLREAYAGKIIFKNIRTQNDVGTMMTGQ